MKEARGPAVCFDTTPLIWGVEGQAHETQISEIDNTKNYIRYLESKRFQIMVPTPVISEYFAKAGSDEMKEKSILCRGFQTPPYDLPTAMIAAELMRTTDLKDLKRRFDITHQAVKVDVQIIATAIKNKAAFVVTNDVKAFTTLARGRIKVISVPNASQLWHADVQEIVRKDKAAGQLNFLDEIYKTG